MTEREAIVTSLAPSAPPCFEDRNQWVEYLKAADRDSVAHEYTSGPLLGKAPSLTFNTSFNFCADCDPAFRTSMLACDRCKPLWLKSDERKAAAAP